jgi:hypothetical protein
MAARFPETARAVSVSYTAYRSAAYTKDPQKVMAEATKVAERQADGAAGRTLLHDLPGHPGRSRCVR